MFSIPDILHLSPRSDVDRDSLAELLELAFLGRGMGSQLEGALGRGSTSSPWNADLFARDLFLRDLVRDVVQVEIGGERKGLHTEHLLRILGSPPADRGAIEFRQDIFRELAEQPPLRSSLEELYLSLERLLTLFKLPDQTARLDDNEHRLETFRQVVRTVELMQTRFARAGSGLRRLADAGSELSASRELQVLRALIDHENRFCRLDVEIALSPEGNVREMSIRGIAEDASNPFYRSPLRRFLDRLRLVAWHGVWPSNREITNRLVREVFDQLSPTLITLVELAAQVEFYLFGLALRERAQREGLATSLPRFADRWELRDAFNPLLLVQGRPVPIDVRRDTRLGTTLITGPNSGGKTRLLQAIGLCQVLGQAGLPVPASSAVLPRVRGLFVSLIETESFDEGEGRLGREMVRIRRLFEGLDRPALVLLDELCSGTNPSEGNELFAMVLQLLDRLGAIAFVSTHFLDFARELEGAPPVAGLEFLRVEIDERQRSTYRFVPGVAPTSLASVTAARLGVTFETLAELIDSRHPGSDETEKSDEPSAALPFRAAADR